MNSILTINAGSSSLKCGLYHYEEGPTEEKQTEEGLIEKEQISLLYRLHIEDIHSDPQFTVDDHHQQTRQQQRLTFSENADECRHSQALQQVLAWLRQQAPDDLITAISHRVVHGGERFSAPVNIDRDTLQQLQQLIPLAPLHQPFNLRLIEACRQALPQVPQVACFDTTFHASQPPQATTFALPRKLTEQGIRRYGFHGLSYEYIMQRLSTLDPRAAEQRLIVAHLGAGASMCAISGGQSIATTMGFTALEGLPMATRCGSLDPGVILYLQQQHQLSSSDIERLLYKESGWLGVSGISADMSELLASSDDRAEQAIDLFCYRAAREIGSLCAALQGLDQLVFTAGVGEHCPQIRARITAQCQWLGAKLDNAANEDPPPDGLISHPDSRVSIRMLATDEERMLAQHCASMLFAAT